MRIKTLIAALLIAAPALASPQVTSGDLHVHSVWARMAPKEPGTASVFFEIENDGHDNDSLIAATSPAARDIVIRRGRWRGFDFFNKETDGVRIKANARTSFHPGAYEVTLKDFTMPLGIGAVVPVTLMFKDAGPVQIEARVANQLLGNRIRK